MVKASLRKRILYIRENELAPEERRRLSLSITEKFLNEFLLPAGITSLGLYYPIRNEVDTLELFQFCLQNGIETFFPRISRNHEMDFFRVSDEKDLKKGTYGIYEPSSDGRTEEASHIPSVIVVPLVAFDARNYRIGYGKGYYDRYISSKKPDLTVGFAYSFQQVDPFPVDEWDIPLHLILTEKGWHGELKNSMSGGSR
ncbi:MAG: 5-formyltetrahydrofolate cyclo-ligase [Deltaproteobacteria bacterium]|nr:MAG: 5-formyltetrahydrofolate cyclo-ligase [Deltaproteobacteria bacterium]